MNKEVCEVIVIGGGASGLMLAANLDLGGAPGIVLEGSASLGSKLLMSGGGRCNFTHGGPMKDFIDAYGDEGPALRKCLYKHSNLEMALRMRSLGVSPADESGRSIDLTEGVRSLDGIGRIFPASGRARDVLDALIGEAASNLWQIENRTKVRAVSRDKTDGCWDITLENGYTLSSRNVVIATGGTTYPETGSDGSMFAILRDLGLDIADPKPALAPVYVENYPYADLAGISIPDVTVTAYRSDAACTCNGKAARMTGDLLFTHEGFSGPVILNISKYTEAGERLRLCYNKELSELPKRVQRALTDRARGGSGDVKTTLLAMLLDHDDFIVKGVDKRGMVTSGGVSLDEVDMQTMSVKRFDGLYVIGEALNVDGITGGYNLQMCWSTASVCADTLREKIYRE